jgi:hypothetical protein
MHAKLAEKILRVRANGIYRYSEISGDGRPIVACRHTVEDLPLSRCEAGKQVVVGVRRPERPLHLLHELPDEP